MILLEFMGAWVIGVLLLLFAGVLAGLLTGIFAAALSWAAMGLVQYIRRETVNHGDNFAGTFFRVGFASFICWTLYFSFLFVQSDSLVARKVKESLTLGYVSAPKPLPVENLGMSIRRYKLMNMNPPKHFYVTFQDVETKQMYERLYVSQHCNSYATNRLGDEYNLSFTTYKQGNSTWIAFTNLYAAFCSN